MAILERLKNYFKGFFTKNDEEIHDNLEREENLPSDAKPVDMEAKEEAQQTGDEDRLQELGENHPAETLSQGDADEEKAA